MLEIRRPWRQNPDRTDLDLKLELPERIARASCNRNARGALSALAQIRFSSEALARGILTICSGINPDDHMLDRYHPVWPGRVNMRQLHKRKMHVTSLSTQVKTIVSLKTS